MNKNVKRQFESQVFSPDSVINPPVNAKRNINRLIEGQTLTLPKSYSAAVNNSNMIINDDLNGPKRIDARNTKTQTSD